MIRHIFIAPVKQGISDDKVDEKLSTMRGIKDHVPGIVSLTVGRNTGWVGISNAVSMVIDVEDKAAFNTFMSHPYHVAIGEAAGDVFDTNGFIISQIEY